MKLAVDLWGRTQIIVRKTSYLSQTLVGLKDYTETKRKSRKIYI